MIDHDERIRALGPLLERRQRALDRLMAAFRPLLGPLDPPPAGDTVPPGPAAGWPGLDDLQSLSIAEFCRLARISRSHYFVQRRLGRTPTERRSGRTVRITVAAARAYLRGEE